MTAAHQDHWVDPIELMYLLDYLLDERARLRGDPDRRAELEQTHARLREVLERSSAGMADEDEHQYKE
jgi:hypothetical protein